jgi:hypothetical protein
LVWSNKVTLWLVKVVLWYGQSGTLMYCKRTYAGRLKTTQAREQTERQKRHQSAYQSASQIGIKVHFYAGQ